MINNRNIIERLNSERECSLKSWQSQSIDGNTYEFEKTRFEFGIDMFFSKISP